MDTIQDFRLSEMEEIQEALACLDKTPKSRKWRAAAAGFFFAALGASPGAILLFDPDTEPAGWIVAAYLIVLGILYLLALLCWFACRDMDAERVESIQTVQARVERVLESYQHGS